MHWSEDFHRRSFVILLACAFFSQFTASILSAQPGESKIRSADRNRLTLEDGTSVQLLGTDMKNLSSKKKPSILFGDEVNKFMRGLAGKTVYLEYDPAYETKGHREGGNLLAYVYYLKATDSIPMDGSQGLSAKPVLMLEEVRNQNDRLQARMQPHLKVLLNSELIEKGYARTDTSRDFRYKNEFLLSERKAQLDKAGIWE